MKLVIFNFFPCVSKCVSVFSVVILLIQFQFILETSSEYGIGEIVICNTKFMTNIVYSYSRCSFPFIVK